MKQEQIKIHSWEDSVYKVSPYPGGASKVLLTLPLTKLNVSGKSLQPERADGMRVLSRSLEDLEEQGEGTAICQGFIIAMGLSWG